MHKEITILLVEDDMIACQELEKCIKNRENMQLVGMTNNASEALDMVKYHLPDVIILDLELHLGGGNGLEFLSQLQFLCLSHEPYILVTTQNSSQLTLDAARLLGADMIITKYEVGYSAEYVIKTISLIENVIHKTSPTDSSDTPESPAEFEHKLRTRIQRELTRLGINPKYKGYGYLVDAILLVYQDPQPNVCVQLGKQYGANPSSIERAMQNAINRTWNTADPEDLQQYYQAVVNSERGVPTIMEFVHYYAQELRSLQ